MPKLSEAAPKPQILTPTTTSTLVERLLIYRTFGGCCHSHAIIDGGTPTVVVSWFYPGEYREYLGSAHALDWGVVEVIFHGHAPRVLLYDAIDLARETMRRTEQFDWMDVAKHLLRPLRKTLRKT